MDINDIWEELVSQELFTEEELQLITNMNGYSIETLNNATYARFGYCYVEDILG